LAARRRLSREARGKQRDVTKDREARSPAGFARFRRQFAVGWCQLTPRDALPWLGRMWWFQGADNLPVWSISCFFVRRDYRPQGIMTQLITAAVKTAKRARVSALEAYPIDTSASKSSSNIFVGTASTFARAGFKEVARRASDHAPRFEGTHAIESSLILKGWSACFAEALHGGGYRQPNRRPHLQWAMCCRSSSKSRRY